MELLATSILDLKSEVNRARAKFPKSTDMFAALGEEVGELARAIEGDGDIRKEALQVACTAMRIYEEGDLTDINAPEYQLVRFDARILEAHSRSFMARAKPIAQEPES